jgi:pimeloyl-ACP methyl ester carboxylesterase
MLEPFEIAAPNHALEDLAQRLRIARLPTDSADEWDSGTSPTYLRELVAYWRDAFDWRAQEKLLNRFRHFRGQVDGTLIHLIHEKGRGPAPLPLLLTHGYPDSFFRFHKLIPLLTEPGAHGGDPADAFDVVAPSLPGYAYSEPRTSNGGLFGFGDLWHTLMTKTLGYDSFGAHGGDWGSSVTEQLARSHSDSLVGIHLTDVPFWHIFEKPSELSADEKSYLAKNERWQREDGAYAMIQATRPRTAAAGLHDSPTGLAAWIVEKFTEWSDCGDDPERSYTKDELLTNIMIYWLTGTIGSSFQPYHDVVSAGARRWMKEKAKEWLGSSKTPTAFALFPKDISSPPREWAERFFNVQRWTAMPRGGHFAALEEPARLAEDLREFFRPLRQ